MNRREFLSALVSGLLGLSRIAAEAQQAGKLPRVGFLAGSTPPPSPRTNAFVTALRDFGYVEGQNVAIEWRASGGRTERLPDLVVELVRLNVDVIVAVDNPAIEERAHSALTGPDAGPSLLHS